MSDNIKYSKDLFENEDFSQFAIATRHIAPNAVDPSRTHFHDFYEILYYYQGSRKLMVNNTTATLNESTIAFIGPYKFHKTYKADNNSCKRVLINFTYDFIRDLNNEFNKRLLTCFNSPTNTITFSPNQAALFKELIQSLLYENNANKDLYTIHIVKTILSHLLLLSSRSISSSSSDISNSTLSAYFSKILEIADFIKNNYQQKITLDMLSKEHFIDKYVLSREFKRIIGVSFVDYLNGVRINEAMSLLLDSNNNITTIAYECGFNSLVHFERTFKKHTNMTAKEYINNNRIKNL